MKEKKDYSGQTERNIEEEYDKKMKEIEMKIAKERRQKEKISQKEKNKKKKEILMRLKKIGLVSGGVVALGLSAFAGWSAHEAYEVSQGEKIILENFKFGGYVDRINRTYGFDYYIGKSDVSYEKFISYLKRAAEENGYNDVQSYIAFKERFDGHVADDVIERDISRKEIHKEAKKAYINGVVDTKEEGASYGK